MLGRPRKGATLKEEVWQTDDGDVVKYSLAYINPRIYSLDNGRVLGYDNSHEFHHRHYIGTVQAIKFDGYETLASRFYKGVNELWRSEDENDHKKTTPSRHNGDRDWRH